MNTYFFVRVRLDKTLGRRSYCFGPYVSLEHARQLLDEIETILQDCGINVGPSTYFVYIDEKTPTPEGWVKVSTRTKLTVSADKITVESE